ncbi:MAG TPA: cation:proton antiporter [Vicinamibacterales bacterium]|nr:cation:proton antiporter [Vicinamibacterales bacterium]
MNSELALHVLLALAVVVIVGHLVGKLLARIGQPPVIGEVLSGILLGPSLVGRLAPGIESYLFPESARPALSVIAQLGVVLYMFVVGLDFDPGSLRRRAAPFVFTSQVSIALPFALGIGLAAFLYPDLSQPGVRLLAFALFMGVAMSITAFPVLARILTDRGLSRTELGVAALTCAAVDDVTAWCLLAVVVGVARATVAGALVSALLAGAFMAMMFLAGRPLAARLARASSDDEPSQAAVTWTLAGLLLSAIVAELIGIHAIFGAFIFGAILPAESAVARQLRLHRTPVTTILFLPAFFALTGLRTEIGLLSSPREWAICALIVLLATAGKFGGTFAAARLMGMPSHFAASLGVLMNTRGLMELVVLNVGLDIGVISPALFTMMVIMALVTTAMTAPLLDLIVPGGRENRKDYEERSHT